MSDRRGNFAQRNSEPEWRLTEERALLSQTPGPRFFSSRCARNGHRSFLNLPGGRGASLNGGDLTVNLLDLCQQRVLVFGQLNELPKCRARDVRQHSPLCAEESRLQPSKASHLGCLTNRGDYGAPANDEPAAKRKHEQDPYRESR